MAYITESAPSTPYTKWARISLFPDAVNYYATGVAFADVTGKIIRHGSTLNNVPNIQIDAYTNPTTLSSTPYAVPGTSGTIQIPPLYGIEDDGTNLNFLISYDGVSSFVVYSASRTAFFTAGPTLIGLGIDAISQPATMNVAHWGSNLPGAI